MYIHTDGLGSPVAKSDKFGNLISGSRTRYEPYGATAAGATPTIGFTGHVNDPATGLIYMQQRYYDPYAGRFLSTDPVLTDAETGSSFNRYIYANNNPFRYIDPDGRETENPYCLTGGGCYSYGSGERDNNHPGGLEHGLRDFKPIAETMGAVFQTGLEGYVWGAQQILLLQAGGFTAKLGLRLVGSIGAKVAVVAESVSLGKASFGAANGIGQLYSPNVVLTGKSILFQDFSVGTARGFMGIGEKGAAELYGPMRQLVAFSQKNGANTITLAGKYVTPEGAALGGGQVGQSFSFTFQANREGLLGFLKQLGKQ
jgi:RHS repeat-associated protein